MAGSWDPNCPYCGERVKFKKNFKRHLINKHPEFLTRHYPGSASQLQKPRDPGPAETEEGPDLELQEDDSDHELDPIDLEDDLVSGSAHQAPYIPDQKPQPYTPGAAAPYTPYGPQQYTQQPPVPGQPAMINASKVIKADRIFNTVSNKLNKKFNCEDFPTLETKNGKEQIEDLQDVLKATMDYYHMNMTPPVALGILIVIVYIAPILLKLNLLDKVLDAITGKEKDKKKEDPKNEPKKMDN